MAIFFRSRSFAAERLISGLILAIYAVSVSSDPRSKGHFLARLSPRRGYRQRVLGFNKLRRHQRSALGIHYDHGNTDYGNTDYGNTDYGNTDYGNTDYGNANYDTCISANCADTNEAHWASRTTPRP
jgi:hypothetical protein